MPRPKMLDINEGIGEAVFYPYSVLVNKCSGSCNDMNDLGEKLCVPNIIKTMSMKIYNFLMQMNETRRVLWHESCKCVCKLNSSICNNKQIWNSDTCTCYCNDDFLGTMSCKKGYSWNPSTCACECDTWCNQGQYLDNKSCVCKNRLINNIIMQCTSIINETEMYNSNNESQSGYNLYLMFFYIFSCWSCLFWWNCLSKMYQK